MKKIALVGCGRISERHIEAIHATEGVEIVLVCEKPLSMSVRESYELFSRIDRAGKTLLPVY